MMDVYHPDFHSSIAGDTRIKKVLAALRLEHLDPAKDYEQVEELLLKAAKRTGLSGWELDRVLYRFGDEVIFALNSRSRKH